MALSVVVPGYQNPYALRHTLSSLTVQSLPTEQFEVIVVDDCSPEPVAELVAQFADVLPVRCERHLVNRGRAAARNTGVAVATGEHVLFLDADSVAHPELLERHVARHADGPDRVVLGRRVESDWRTAGRFTDPGTLPDVVPPHLDDARIGFEVETESAVDSSPWVFMVSHNFSLSRRTFVEVGGFDEAFDRWGWEDTELAYRLYLHWERAHGRFVYDPTATCYHVPHYADFGKNWENARSGLEYLTRKHEHYEVERLGEYPRDQVLNLPTYAAFLERAVDASAQLAPELERSLPAAGRRLWAGRGAHLLRHRPTATLDVTSGRTESNKPLLGLKTPWPDGSFDDVVHWENWRVLTVADLGSLIRESLRLAGTLYLAGTVAPPDEHPVARPADVLGALQTSPFAVREIAVTDSLWVIEVRP
ncbi:glycosyltransferase family 2 protein [Micromonospora sp. RTGN7]|uniref:glycosyltransferase family 2 protein n=1 Tax=Micromonospora sp. RTGN7 TaxID=3016526 RepID=UPI0029FF1BC7|nr:glycosyltransferase [Micromonospora sp. RTGN7]